MSHHTATATIDIGIDLEEGAHPPYYATEEAAGADVKAHISETITLAPGERKLIPTGIRLTIPAGYEVQVRPRSGLALKHGITVLNSPGTIDSDYRGEVLVLLINHSTDPFIIEPGMRIAQLVVASVTRAYYQTTQCVAATTARGERGFGHTGTQ